MSLRITLTAYGSSQVRGQIELQLLATATATATPDLSRICNLHHSSGQWRIPNPLSKARDQTRILMDTSWVYYCLATMGTLDGINF